jgi:aminoglycoside/choline kinase family phosphotransferase
VDTRSKKSERQARRANPAAHVYPLVTRVHGARARDGRGVGEQKIHELLGLGDRREVDPGVPLDGAVEQGHRLLQEQAPGLCAERDVEVTEHLLEQRHKTRTELFQGHQGILQEHRMPAFVPENSLAEDQARAFLARTLGTAEPVELVPLTGGASPRRFLRVLRGASERAVVMIVPPDTPDVMFARERGRPWPFLELRALLESRSVRVPRLLAEDTGAGLLLVEDLGETLAERLDAAPASREALYRMAATDLARAQRALVPLPGDSVVLLRGFDEALYRTELEHFWEWGVEARGVPGAARADFERAGERLIAELCALPRAFTHRDYQSRNLMVTAKPSGETELAWIDFQDALLGPRAYDLVALLCDSYQPFDPAFVRARLADYARTHELLHEDRAALEREFWLIAVQRKLKDAGRFVFIERKRGDPSFLPFVDGTLDMVLFALAELADVEELHALVPLVRAAQGR